MGREDGWKRAISTLTLKNSRKHSGLQWTTFEDGCPLVHKFPGKVAQCARNVSPLV